jgi:hypothetical protein
MTVDIKPLVGEFAVAAKDGDTVYNLIQAPLERGESVQLDFTGVRVIATPFFNAAIGRLIKDIDPTDLQARMTFTNLLPVGYKVLETVIANSKEYYHDPEARAALDRILTGDVDN